MQSKDLISISEPTKNVIDAVSVGTVVGSLAGLLPSIAALFTIVGTGIRIWETETVQRWLNRKTDA